MNVTLFVPCYIDACYPKVGQSVVEILERLGHTIDCPREITCCGQPSFNSGYWDETREVAVKVIDRLKDAEVVVIISGSCGAMVKNFYPELFKGRPEEAAALALSEKVYEFSDFLVTKLGVTDLGARFPHKVTFHDGCHGRRELGIKAQPRALMAQVKGLELIEMEDAEVCCGFGGTFSAKFPSVSSAMGDGKIASALETGAEYIVSNDSSCLMHQQGLIDRQNQPIKTIHLAEVLNHR
ncbi:MAG: (Fe-S)-binding protein [Chthoniobacteraceae bacterium]